MIAEARKGESPANLTFEIADAMDLPYSDHSFDAVLIANALHIVPDPEKVLKEIDRVLRPGGILIAPNFVEHKGNLYQPYLVRDPEYCGSPFRTPVDRAGVPAVFGKQRLACST